LAEISSLNSAIKSFCIYVKEKVIGNQDNPITDAIIIELRKEVFIEEFDQSNKEIEYFRDTYKKYNFERAWGLIKNKWWRCA
jgi:hypothetical protein